VHNAGTCGQRGDLPLHIRQGSGVRPAAVPDALRDGVFRGSWAVSSRLLTRRQLERATWRRLWHDIYAHAALPVTHQLRAEGACLLLPHAIVTGKSAAVLWGVELAGPEDDVEVTLPPSSGPRRHPGLVVRRAAIPREHRWRRSDVPVTTPVATAVRLAVALPGDDAVVAIDQMIASGFADLEPVRALAAVGVGPGSARARAVCDLADGLAGSPQETRLRLLIHRSGLPAPVAQFQVRDGRGNIARVDFGWPERKVAVEYDGLWHADDKQFAKDRRRLNRLRAAGWTVVFVTAVMLARPQELIAEIASALGL
jgi:Protein of unknown function (DUF559)